MVITTEITNGSEKSLYRKVIDEILRDIQIGKLPLGSKLPSQSELIQKYKVSTGTIRQSLAGLERRGIIRKEHGRGSFISLQSGREEKTTELRDLGLIFERAGKPEDRASEAEIVQAFLNVCREHQIRFTCVETEVDAHAGGMELIKTFDGISLDGVCVFFHSGENAAERLAPLAREFAAPVAFFPATEEHDIPMDCVDIELRTGLQHLMKYLLAMGHRRIGYVSSYLKECLEGDPRRMTGGRWQAYVEALKNAEIPIDRSLLVEIPYGEEPGEEVGKKVIDLVRRPEPATAVFAGNDWMARHVMEWFWKAGIHVPNDVSVAGLDDVSFSRHLIPKLTTVACPYVKAAEAIIGLMRQRLANPNRPIQKLTISSELMVRDSVKPVA
jgi:GntR family transcriptional regulator, arabinose operon transcriptional repressor